MKGDMTHGSPAGILFRFAIPFFIGNLFQQFYSFADTLIVGRYLGSEGIAAIGTTASIVNFSISPLCAIMSGFAAITAQRFGAKDMDDVKKSFGVSITLSSVLIALTMFACIYFAYPILRLINTPQAIIHDAYSYVIWIFIGLFASMLYNLFAAMIRALGNSRIPIVFLIISCIINVILDIVFVGFCNMNVAGAGIATTVSQLLSGLMCLAYIFIKMPVLRIRPRDLIPDIGMTYSLLKIGIPLLLMQLVINLGDAISGSVNNTLGTSYVVSLTASSRIMSFIFMPFTSLATALSVYTAQNYGAKKYDRIKKGASVCFVAMLTFNIAVLIAMIFAGKPLIGFILGGNDAEIITNGYYYVIVTTLSCILVAPIFICKFVLNPVGRTTTSLISGFVEVIFRGGTAFILVRYIGFWGIILINPITWTGVLIPLAIDYWLFMKKIDNNLIKQQ